MRNHPIVVRLCITIVLLLIGNQSVWGQACDIAQLYVKSFEMEKTVETGKEVTRAAVTSGSDLCAGCT